MLNWSQQKFVHIIIVLLSWCVWNFVVINQICYEQERCNFSLNFEFNQNIVSWTGARKEQIFSGIAFTINHETEKYLRVKFPSCNYSEVKFSSNLDLDGKFLCEIYLRFVGRLGQGSTYFNSLWPGDTIGQHESALGIALVQVSAPSGILAFWLMLSVLRTTLNKAFLSYLSYR